MQKTPARYNPGELDKTRENLGNLNETEAQRMIKVLGGEIGTERAAPLSEDKKKEVQAVARTMGTSTQTQHPAHKQKLRQTHTNTKNAKTGQSSIFNNTNKHHTRYRLPPLSYKEKQAFEKIMASNEYQIRPHLGFFAFLISFATGGSERISSGYVNTELPLYIQHLENFVNSMHVLLMAAPSELKQQISEAKTDAYKILKIISAWKIEPLRHEFEIIDKKSNVTTLDLVPFVKLIYTPLLQFYFVGTAPVTLIIKQLYAYISRHNPDEQKQETLLQTTKKALAEWLYLYGHIAKGLYPLLMRMILKNCEHYEGFFTRNISKILPFLNLTKYDLILSKRDQEISLHVPKISTAENTKENTEKEEEQKSPDDTIILMPSQKILTQSLAVLERLFPLAGWQQLHLYPDMYAYFQSLFSFKDGFNLISPAHPIQITIVLLRIIEDFFQGCRNIKFNLAELPETNHNDSLANIFSEWTAYREVLFDKILAPQLKEYTHQLASHSDFKNSKYGKKQLSNWLWQIKYYFLPHLQFDIVFIERPPQSSDYLPLLKRIEYILEVFSQIIKAGTNPKHLLPANVNDLYTFDLPNAISYRLDILLGGKKSKNRTNFNLIQYTLCALRVLYWWIYAPNSLAYKNKQNIPYRIDGESGELIFSVPLRSDQKQIFLNTVKQQSSQ